MDGGGTRVNHAQAPISTADAHLFARRQTLQHTVRSVVAYFIYSTLYTAGTQRCCSSANTKNGTCTFSKLVKSPAVFVPVVAVGSQSLLQIFFKAKTAHTAGYTGNCCGTSPGCNRCMWLQVACITCCYSRTLRQSATLVFTSDQY